MAPSPRWGGSGPHRSWSGAVERPARPEHHASAARHAGRVPRQRPRFAADRTDEAGAPEAARVGAQRLGARLAEDRAARRRGASSCRHGGERSCFRTGVELCRARLGEFWRRLAARHDRRRRARPLRPGRQHVDRHLQQDRRPRSPRSRSTRSGRPRTPAPRATTTTRATRRSCTTRSATAGSSPTSRSSASGSAPPFYECIAVSQTGDPVNGGWYFYAVRADDATHPWFPDYPKMGIWPDGLYMTANMFQGEHLPRGSRLGVQPHRSRVRRAASQRRRRSRHGELLQHAAEQHAHRGRRAAGRHAQLLRRGIADRPSRSRCGSSTSTTRAAARRSPGPTNVSQATYSRRSGNVPTPANPLDTLFDRLMNQAQYSNIGGASPSG